jgi:uncharacterized protein YbjT (DUF2867 family)
MKIIVIGGSGLIGSRLVNVLAARGHQAVAASPRTGVNALTGEGLLAALDGAQVVVDVTNSPSFADRDVLEFFETSSRNVLAAATASGVKHYVALSVVGADRLHDSGYMRAKRAQEKLIERDGIAYTILRATQFFEFIESIIASSVHDDAVHLSPALIQPIAADDVVAALADVVLAPPVNGMVEVGGPESLPLDKIAAELLAAKDDGRKVVPDIHARYFGAALDDSSLVTGHGARIGATHFHDWLSGAART